MPLESLTIDGPNIKSLALEQPCARILPFEPERDLLPEDWEAFEHQVVRLRSHGEWEKLFKLLENLKFLAPDRSFFTPLDSVSWKRLRAKLRKTRGENAWYTFLHIGTSMLHCFPEKQEQLYRDAVAIRGAQSEIERRLQSHPQFPHDPEVLMRARILFPEAHDRFPVPGKTLSFVAQQMQMARGNNEWQLFGELGCYLRLLAPEQWNHSMITDDDWKQLHSFLEEMRRTPNTERARAAFAANMRILAVDHATITRNGITLIPRVPPKDVPSPMPAVRHFLSSIVNP